MCINIYTLFCIMAINLSYSNLKPSGFQANCAEDIPIGSETWCGSVATTPSVAGR